MTKKSEIINKLFEAIPSFYKFHSPTHMLYDLLKTVTRKEIESLFSNNNETIDIVHYGEINFPYFKMGAIDSLNLFDIDELILFSYYSHFKHRYKKALDIGANIGLHSIMMGKCGFEVRSFEPDPIHYQKLVDNINHNHIATVTTYNVAVSSKAGEVEFIRVLGNTTGSHIAGSKANPYGELEKFPVNVVPIQDHLKWADLVKMDAEGHEKEIILGTKLDDWLGKDAIIEVGSQDNAYFLFDFFKNSKIKLFSQKINWSQVMKREDMPYDHHDGSLFLTSIKDSVWSD